MTSKLKIDTRVRALKKYLEEFENGAFQIPSFQRDFLWSQDDIKDLFESIKRSYPIGSILFWKPTTEYAESWSNPSESKIGPYKIKQTEQSDSTYILDGYQRLSTLFGCLTNPDKYKTNVLDLNHSEWSKTFNLFYDLEEEEFIYLRSSTNKEAYQIPVYIFMNSIDFRQYARKHFESINISEEQIERYYDRADELGQIFNNYDIASVDINFADITEAVEIFRRINEKGVQISKDWIVSALTNTPNFRLGSEIDVLLQELKGYEFDKLKRDILFQCIQSSFGKIYFDYKIEDLVKRADFESTTRLAIESIKKAVKFLYEHLFVLNSRLLPYNAQLIFLTVFFNEVQNISEHQIITLKKWFWITSYSNYFTINSLSNQRKSFNRFRDFIFNEEIDPVYYDNDKLQFTALDFPQKITMGSVRAKSLALFMINYALGIKGISVYEINAENIESFELGSLFSLPQSDNCSENYIPIIEKRIEDIDSIKIESLSRKKRPSDYSKLLKQENTDIFISATMVDIYLSQNLTLKEKREKILSERKLFIIAKEKAFVEAVKIVYE